MPPRAALSATVLLAALSSACDPGSGLRPPPGGAGGPSGGAGGEAPGAGGGGGAGGTGGAPQPGGGGTGGAAGGGVDTGIPPAPDGAAADTRAAPADAAGADRPSTPSDSGAAPPPPPPPSSGQGPIAEGTIRYSQDFEQNMDGMSRSPNNLPEDRIQIIDDPVGQRGKIVRIQYREGDNFRTSAGTQPRSWFSAAKGYTVKPGTTVSLAWGFMWENVNMNAHFAQIIREGGPIWMWDVDGGGTVSMTFHRGSGRTGPIMKLEPMKWYDFMVVTTYREGGECRFYLNGKMVGTGRSVGGADARFDFGTYWRPGAHPARTVYISNVSIGEL